jgi:hypothetical protein
MEDVQKERVTIAKKALEELEQKWIVATFGEYFTAPDLLDAEPGEKMVDVLNDKTCEVCAIGAILVGAIDTFDSVRVDDLMSLGMLRLENAFGYLGKWFSRSQLRLMEVAFEGGAVSDGFSCLTQEEREKGEEFFSKYHKRGGKFLLRKILQNIVDNDGTFTP